MIRRRGSSLHCRVVASAPSASVAELWLTSVWGTGAVQLRLYHGAASSLYGGWEAEAKGKRADDHFLHLLVHGILHLLGYDHLNDDDANVMEAEEARILAVIGIADPYQSLGGV